ncbi:MAG TPA: hypothetical protein VM286_07155 [Candidatus Thermoplasmatota archaeon]|nr:hypothetical protein [Candidatus Thermoplasmatota archaeon]
MQRLALVEFAAALLGQAFITRQGRTRFTVHEINGRPYHIVEDDGKLRCMTCNQSDQDPHCALILLYLLAVEGGRTRRA